MKKPTRKARRRKAQLDHEIIRFGTHKVSLYRRGDVKESSWFFRVHVKEEDRFYRKSLRTRDRGTAIERAQAELVGLLAKIQSGQRILSASLRELLKRYSLHVEERVRQGQLSPRTWIAQRYRLKSGCEFLKAHYPTGMDTKLTSIDGDLFHRYLTWRQEQAAAKARAIRRDVIRDELLVIRKMFLWAQKARLCTAKSVPNWDFMVERQGPKRPRITYENYRDFFNTVFSWVNESKGVKDAYQRRVLMYIAAAVTLSGMRSGEIFALKNGDIERRGKTDCLVSIRAETSKVRRGRQIIVPRMLAKWVDEFQRHKEPSAFAFSPYADGRRSARDVFYHYYKSLRERLKDVGLEWFDLYHCRHWWITNRLLAEEPIYLVAQAAGTSVKEIESTYSHVVTELTTKRFAEKKVVWKPDGSYEVIKQLEQDRSPT